MISISKNRDVYFPRTRSEWIVSGVLIASGITSYVYLSKEYPKEEHTPLRIQGIEKELSIIQLENGKKVQIYETKDHHLNVEEIK